MAVDNNTIFGLLTQLKNADPTIVSQGLSNEYVIPKNGINHSVTTALTDIWNVGGTLNWLTAAATLDIVSDNSNDTSNGTGARAVTIYGLNSAFALQQEEVSLSGTTPVTLTQQFLRVYQMRVTSRGSYNTCNAGNITLSVTGGGATQAKINHETDFDGIGTTRMTHFTVPAGYTAYVNNFIVNVEASKPVGIAVRIRQNADDVSAPYLGQFFPPIELLGVTGLQQIVIPIPFKLPAKTDIWWQAIATGVTTGFVGVNYNIHLIPD